MAMQKVSIGAFVVVAVVLLMTSVLAILTSNTSVPNSGEIKGINVSVYQNSACTIPLSSWNWGVLEPGSSTLKTMYVKNEGNMPMTLNLTTITWTPSSAATYVTVTWNREGAVVTAGSNVQANVTLAVSPSITGITSFSFTMVITGTG
jgi:hypothetical protein